MTRLLLDLGNTRLKWARLTSAGLAEHAALRHPDADLDELLDQAWSAMPRPSAVHAAGVAAEPIRARVADWLRRHWHLEVQWAAVQAMAQGLRNGYTEPARLGVDRWLAMLGAWRLWPGPLCVVDCGSAVTVDLVDAEGQHQGGWILPGLGLMRVALHEGTDLAPAAPVESVGFARDTDAAISSGTLHAVIGLIEQAMGLAPADTRLVLTGGDHQLVARHLGRPCETCPDLVLQGLAGSLDGV